MMEGITEVSRTILKVDNFVVNTHGTGALLRCAAKRYTVSGVSLSRDSPGYVLVFAHGSGFHKEHWEVTIQRLFEHSSYSGPRIVEAWAVDSPSHGASAEWNAPIIDDPTFVYRAQDYGEACANLYKEFIMDRIRPGIHKVFLLGHSAGATAVALAPTFLDEPSFNSLILIEPAIWPEHVHGKETAAYKRATRGIPQRTSKWTSRVEAKRFLGSRAPGSQWDSRILDIYVKHGLKPLPDGGVALRCSPKHEADPFILAHNALAPIPVLNSICHQIPIHVVFGKINDMFASTTQEALLKGRHFASVTRIPGAGHMVVQEAPDDLADAIFGLLLHDRQSRL